MLFRSFYLVLKLTSNTFLNLYFHFPMFTCNSIFNKNVNINLLQGEIIKNNFLEKISLLYNVSLQQEYVNWTLQWLQIRSFILAITVGVKQIYSMNSGFMHVIVFYSNLTKIFSNSFWDNKLLLCRNLVYNNCMCIYSIFIKWFIIFYD